MNNKTRAMTQIQVRIDSETKEGARKVLDGIGLDISTAIKTFLKQVIMVGGLPYELKDINGYTKKEIKDVKESYNEAIKDNKPFDTVAEALKDLNK